MIVLPDEDDAPVGAQVYATIGDLLRQSVAEVEPSPGFAARLAAALDAAERAQDGQAAPAVEAGAASAGAGGPGMEDGGSGQGSGTVAGKSAGGGADAAGAGPASKAETAAS